MSRLALSIASKRQSQLFDQAVAACQLKKLTPDQALCYFIQLSELDLLINELQKETNEPADPPA